MTSFELFASLFADNCKILFETEKDMVTGTSYLFNHLCKCGLKILAGSGTTASKTETMYYPTSAGPYEDDDTKPFTVYGPGGEYPGFAGFTKEFKCLGSIVGSSLTSDADVDKCTRSAAAALGALRSVPCNFPLEMALRARVYSVLVLAALFYGSEVPP